MAQLNFNAENVDPNTGFDPVPAGEYVAFIEESEVKPTKANTGMYLQLVWQICEGEFQGRKLWHRINIQNQSKQAEEIGQKELSAVCHATGVIKVGDSSELHDKPCILKVAYKPAEGEFLASNEVKGVKSLAGQAAPSPQQGMFGGGQSAPANQQQPAAAAAAGPAPQAPAGNKPPWAK